MTLKCYKHHCRKLQEDSLTNHNLVSNVFYHHSYIHNLRSCTKKAEKIQACRDSNPDLCETGAVL